MSSWRLPLLFARRYLFSKKSTNAIHIISAISVLGIALGSMALLVILSVFNGFEELVSKMMTGFRPELRIEAKEGKVFRVSEGQLDSLRQLPELRAVSQVLEEVALFEYNGMHNIGRLKGVDEEYKQVSRLDTIISRGEYLLQEGERNYAIVGSTLEYTLGISVQSLHPQPIKIYMPKRKGKISGRSKPFLQREVYAQGLYSINEVDVDNHLITNLALVQDLLYYDEGEISALEIALETGTRVEQAKANIAAILGDAYLIKDRYEQDEAFFKIANMEKWVGYIIFSFTLLLVAFNMVGALWMLVLEKKQDIATLKALGAPASLIRRIFLAEGFWLSFIGLLIGSVVAFVLCWLQESYGLLRLGASGDFVTDAYPVSMRISDFVLVALTVLCIGTLASVLPAWRAARVAEQAEDELA